MLVQFLTDQKGRDYGFKAQIHYTQINPMCKEWLNITFGFLTSPNHPTMNCSWVITAIMGSTILIQFHFFEVKMIINAQRPN